MFSLLSPAQSLRHGASILLRTHNKTKNEAIHHQPLQNKPNRLPALAMAKDQSATFEAKVPDLTFSGILIKSKFRAKQFQSGISPRHS